MRNVVFILCMLLLVACGKNSGPQRPSRWLGKTLWVDTTELNLMQLNQRLATEADAELMQYVQQQEESYALYRSSAWVHIIETGNIDREPYTYGQMCLLHMRIYAVNKKKMLLSDVYQSFKVDPSQLPGAVVDVVRELHPGAQARIIAPWYAAYGMKGNAQIPPYQNVIIELTIEE